MKILLTGYEGHMGREVRASAARIGDAEIVCGVDPMAPEGVPVVRPLLCTTRDYIEHYLRDKRHLNWVTDSTNSDVTITRNAIREQLRTYTKAEIEHIA